MYALQMLYCTRIDMYAFNFVHLSYLKVLKNTSLSLSTFGALLGALKRPFCEQIMPFGAPNCPESGLLAPEMIIR